MPPSVIDIVPSQNPLVQDQKYAEAGERSTVHRPPAYPSVAALPLRGRSMTAGSSSIELVRTDPVPVLYGLGFPRMHQKGFGNQKPLSLHRPSFNFSSTNPRRIKAAPVAGEAGHRVAQQKSFDRQQPLSRTLSSLNCSGTARGPDEVYYSQSWTGGPSRQQIHVVPPPSWSSMYPGPYEVGSSRSCLDVPGGQKTPPASSLSYPSANPHSGGDTRPRRPGRQLPDPPRGRSSRSVGRSPPVSPRNARARAKPVHGFAIGIETEFILESCNEKANQEKTPDFLTTIAALHNQTIDTKYPRIDARIEYSSIVFDPPDDDFTRWAVVEEPGILKVEDNPGKCEYFFDHYAIAFVDKHFVDGVETKTPKLRTSRTPNWRECVKATWAFVERHYVVSKTNMCSTHVHVSVARQGGSGMGRPNMKKIAQCIIHWEPALEVLVPEERRGNVYASSNWIDNKNFESLTRSEAIEMIENCRSLEEVILLMSPKPQGRFWAWNFQAMRKSRTIEFRKGGASLNGEQALAWAELVLLFIEAAVQTDIESLRTVPAIIKTLKIFLGEDKLNNVKPLFEGKKDQESVQPTIVGKPSFDTELLRQKMLKKDANEQRRLIQNWRA